jgi:hypothetical protein
MSNNIRIIGDNKSETLVLFIHGFIGGAETWRCPNAPSFPEFLNMESELNPSYDFGFFEYYTKLVDLYPKVQNSYSKVSAWINPRYRQAQKNIPVSEIAALLKSAMKYQLSQYQKIIIVAHSMGGLVAKKAIAEDLKESGSTKIQLFVSLAVPHQGAEGATFGSMISSNIQIKNLKPINEFIMGLSQDWISLRNKPKTLYCYGTNDRVVEKASAIALKGDDNYDEIAFYADHISICKPPDINSAIYSTLKTILLDFKHHETKLSGMKYQPLENDESFDDMVFVLKLVVADVHHSTVKDCKELFLNAEYIRKFLKSADEQEKLESLYVKIRQLYKDSYNSFVNGKDITSGELVAEVHKKISEQDGALLKSLSEYVQEFHKKGMLHQLANDQSNDIWWSKEQTLKTTED